MKLVTCFGEAFKISDRNWAKYLLAVSTGDKPDIADFGARSVGIIHMNITDLTASDAYQMLAPDDDDSEGSLHMRGHPS